MPPTSSERRSKPNLVLVHGPSILRGFMEQSLRANFTVRMFDGAEDALDYARKAPSIDILVSELDLGNSPLGGCNIAREVKQRFPDSLVFIFLGGRPDDHRLDILSALSRVTILDKPLGALFLSRRIRKTLNSS